MALIIGAPYEGAGTLVPSPGDDFFLPAGIVIYSQASALRCDFSNNDLTIEGTLMGDYAIQLSSFASGHTINVSATGVVAGTEFQAIVSSASNVSIINRGLIIGEEEAILQNAAGGTVLTIVNYGRIIGEKDAIKTNGDPVTLKNFGTVSSYLGPAFTGSGNVDKVTNAGVMDGLVNLGGGADVYEGNGGRVKGTVFGIGGADQLRGGALTDVMHGGSENDTLLGRGGRDDLTGGAHNDTFDYNAITDSGPTAATRDIIRDFNTGNDKIDLFDIDANTGVTGNQRFALLAKGTAVSAVGTGKIGWYWIDNANNALDRTILRINNDADAVIEMQIELVGLKTLSALAGVDFVF